MFSARVYKSVRVLDEAMKILREESRASETPVEELTEETAETASPEIVNTPPVIPDFTEERQKVIAEAQAETKKMVETARIKAKTIEKNAYEKGFLAGKQQGISEGQDLGKQEVESLVGTLNKLIAGVEKNNRELVEKSEPGIIKLVLDIARKVIQTEVKQDKSIVLKLVEEGIKSITERERLKIRVNLEDIENLMENREILLACADGIKSIEFQKDARVGVGGCIIETPAGTVDARLDTQLEVVARAFDDMLKEAGGNR